MVGCVQPPVTMPKGRPAMPFRHRMTQVPRPLRHGVAEGMPLGKLCHGAMALANIGHGGIEEHLHQAQIELIRELEQKLLMRRGYNVDAAPSKKDRKLAHKAASRPHTDDAVLAALAAFESQQASTPSHQRAPAQATTSEVFSLPLPAFVCRFIYSRCQDGSTSVVDGLEMTARPRELTALPSWMSPALLAGALPRCPLPPMVPGSFRRRRCRPTELPRAPAVCRPTQLSRLPPLPLPESTPDASNSSENSGSLAIGVRRRRCPRRNDASHRICDERSLSEPKVAHGHGAYHVIAPIAQVTEHITWSAAAHEAGCDPHSPDQELGFAPSDVALQPPSTGILNRAACAFDLIGEKVSKDAWCDFGGVSQGLGRGPAWGKQYVEDLETVLARGDALEVCPTGSGFEWRRPMAPPPPPPTDDISDSIKEHLTAMGRQRGDLQLLRQDLAGALRQMTDAVGADALRDRKRAPGTGS